MIKVPLSEGRLTSILVIMIFLLLIMGDRIWAISAGVISVGETTQKTLAIANCRIFKAKLPLATASV